MSYTPDHTATPINPDNIDLTNMTPPATPDDVMLDTVLKTALRTAVPSTPQRGSYSAMPGSEHTPKVPSVMGFSELRSTEINDAYRTIRGAFIGVDPSPQAIADYDKFEEKVREALKQTLQRSKGSCVRAITDSITATMSQPTVSPAAAVFNTAIAEMVMHVEAMNRTLSTERPQQST